MKIERLKINLKNENFRRIVEEDGTFVFRMRQKVTGRGVGPGKYILLLTATTPQPLLRLLAKEKDQSGKLKFQITNQI